MSIVTRRDAPLCGKCRGRCMAWKKPAGRLWLCVSPGCPVVVVRPYAAAALQAAAVPPDSGDPAAPEWPPEPPALPPLDAAPRDDGPHDEKDALWAGR